MGGVNMEKKQKPNEKDKRIIQGDQQFQEETANEPLTEMERQHNKKTKKRQ
jgi:small acid-soluble spore protein O